MFHHQHLYMTSSTPPAGELQSLFQVASLFDIQLSSNALTYNISLRIDKYLQIYDCTKANQDVANWGN